MVPPAEVREQGPAALDMIELMKRTLLPSLVNFFTRDVPSIEINVHKVGTGKGAKRFWIIMSVMRLSSAVRHTTYACM